MKILLFFLVLVTFILAGFLVSQFTGRIIYIQEKANITRIIDGDTLDTDVGRVRMLGINTPEKNEQGFNEASNFLKKYWGKDVSLISTNEDKDKYNRLLRYISYNNQLVNEQILALGLAHFYSYTNDEYTEELKQAEEQARLKNLGIWQKSKDECASCIQLIKLNPVDPGEYVLLKNNCNFNCNLQDWFIKDDASNKRKLNFSLSSLEQIKLDYSGRVWNDAGDSLYLRDEQGLLVLFFRY